MSIINDILLTGWFQLIVFAIVFFAYSSRVLRRQLGRGYMLGWLIGIFFIFVYASLNPPQSFRFGAYDGELNFMQVFIATVAGLFVGALMIGAAYLFRNSLKQKSLSAATVTSMLVIAIFFQIIAEPDLRLMISLFMLAFGIMLLTANILLSRRYSDTPYNAQSDYDYVQEPVNNQMPRTRLDMIRQKVVDRIRMNNVPTNYPNTPNNG